jgi:hypothetical protein
MESIRNAVTSRRAWKGGSSLPPRRVREATSVVTMLVFVAAFGFFARHRIRSAEAVPLLLAYFHHKDSAQALAQVQFSSYVSIHTRATTEGWPSLFLPLAYLPFQLLGVPLEHPAALYSRVLLELDKDWKSFIQGTRQQKLRVKPGIEKQKVEDTEDEFRFSLSPAGAPLSLLPSDKLFRESFHIMDWSMYDTTMKRVAQVIKANMRDVNAFQEASRLSALWNVHDFIASAMSSTR